MDASLGAEQRAGSDMAVATLTPQPGMAAEVPSLRKRPLATMRDMRMYHAARQVLLPVPDETRSKHVTGIQSDLSRWIRATVDGSGEPNHRMIAASNKDPAPAMLNNVSDDRSLRASISPNTSTALTSWRS